MSDDFEYMLAFVSRSAAREAQLLKMKEHTGVVGKRIPENEEDPTIAIAREARAQKKQDNLSKEQQRLLELTISNMESAKRQDEAAALAEAEDKTKAAQDVKEEKFTLKEGTKKAQLLSSSGYYTDALKVWRALLNQHAETLRNSPTQALQVLLSMGKTYFFNEDYRLTISCLRSALYIAQENQKVAEQREINQILADACEALGKFSEAEAYRKLVGTQTQKEPRKTTKDSANRQKELRTNEISISGAEQAVLDQLLEKCVDGNFSGIESVLDKGGKLAQLLLSYQHSGFGTTLLMAAAANSKLEIVQKLLSAGADPNLLSSSGSCALEHAIKSEDGDIIRALRDNDASLPSGVKPADLEAIMNKSHNEMQKSSSGYKKKLNKKQAVKATKSKKGEQQVVEANNQSKQSSQLASKPMAKSSTAQTSTAVPSKPFVWGQQSIPKSKVADTTTSSTKEDAKEQQTSSVKATSSPGEKVTKKSKGSKHQSKLTKPSGSTKQNKGTKAATGVASADQPITTDASVPEKPANSAAAVVQSASVPPTAVHQQHVPATTPHGPISYGQHGVTAQAHQSQHHMQHQQQYHQQQMWQQQQKQQSTSKSPAWQQKSVDQSTESEGNWPTPKAASTLPKKNAAKTARQSKTIEKATDSTVAKQKTSTPMIPLAVRIANQRKMNTTSSKP